MLFDKEKEYVKERLKEKKKLLNMNTEPFYK